MLVKKEIGERGQFVVPKDVREQLGFHPGTEVTVDVKDGKMIVEPAKSVDEFLKEFFTSSKRLKIKGDPVKWFKKRLDEQYEEEYGLR